MRYSLLSHDYPVIVTDPEEFLNLLFKEILHSDPFIIIKYVQ